MVYQLRGTKGVNGAVGFGFRKGLGSCSGILILDNAPAALVGCSFSVKMSSAVGCSSVLPIVVFPFLLIEAMARLATARGISSVLV
jgi:hypothetical protein